MGLTRRVDTPIPRDDPERRERMYRQRAEQGLPPTIEDPVIIRRIARLIAAVAERTKGKQ